MLIYTLRRLNLLFFTLLLLSFFAYWLEYHLSAPSDQSLLPGYFHYLERLLQGDLGLSRVTGQPVRELILRHAPATLELCLTAVLIASLLGIPLGTLAALYKGRSADIGILGASLLGYSIPVYWLAMLVIATFSMRLGWFPSSGQLGLLYEIAPVTGLTLLDTWLSEHPYRMAAFLDALHHLLLPALVLALAPTTEVIRQVRNSMANVLKQNYIKAAFSRGHSSLNVVLFHGLRNALPPILPILSLQFGTIVTSAIITEVVFEWPGLGRWLVTSIAARDYAAIQAGMLVIASLLVLANILTELFTTLLYPAKRKELYGHQG